MRSPVRVHWNQSRLKTDLLLSSMSGISYLRLCDQRLLWRIYFSSTLCHLSAYSRKLFIVYLLLHFTGFFVEIDALVAAELYEKKIFFISSSVRTRSSRPDIEGASTKAMKTSLKLNVRPSFNLCCFYLDPLNLSNVADFFWRWILKEFIQVQKRKGKFTVVCSRPP